jgi:hypothetical protein
VNLTACLEEVEMASRIEYMRPDVVLVNEWILLNVASTCATRVGIVAESDLFHLQDIAMNVVAEFG